MHPAGYSQKDALPQPATQAKKELRSKIRALLNQTEPDALLQMGMHAARNLEQTEEFRASKNVMFYVSHAYEVDTIELIKRHLKHKTVLVPRIDMNLKRMCAVRITSLGELAEGAYGIPEPVSAEAFPERDIELVIVPGIAFDAKGNRLGRGLGYYDRFLKQTPAVKVGLCYDFQIVESVPAESFDVPMDMVVSDKRTIIPGGG